MSTQIEKADGKVETVLGDEYDSTVSTTKQVMEVILPTLKDALGESMAQTIRDQMEESFEKIAKAQEQNAPVNRTSVLDGAREQLAAEKQAKREAKNFLEDYIKYAGQAKGDIEDAAVRASKNGRGAVAKALNASDENGLGILVPDSIQSAILELKDNKTVMRSIAPPSMIIKGNHRIPREATRATAFWAKESEDMTLTSFSLDEDEIFPRKLTVLMVATQELLDDAVDSQGKITRHMARVHALEEDVTFLSSTGGSKKPTGLLHQIQAANKVARTAAGGAGTATTAEIFKDLVEMMRKIKAANHDVSAAGNTWLMNSSTWAGLINKLGGTDQTKFFLPEVMAGRLMGIPFRETNQIPDDVTDVAAPGSRLYLVTNEYITIADGQEVTLNASMDASYLLSGSLVSAFSRNEVAYRLTSRTDFYYEYPDGAAVLQDVDWHL